MENKKTKKIDKNMVSNPTNYIDSFRHNIFQAMEEQDLSLRELSELADMPFETLKSFLYGNSKDCKLSTAVKLSRAFNVSIDELVGAETMHPLSKQSIAMCREMPDYVVYLIRSFIRHQYNLQKRCDENSINIPVLLPDCHNGYLQTTNVTDTVCIDHLTNGLKSRICLGIKVPCEHYEPFYMPNEIILLAADRDGQHNERCVVSYKGNFFICRKIFFIDNGQKKYKYVSLIGGTTEILPSDIDDKIGYVVGYLNPDNSWGVR
ncbi:MAG: helix-turn-helix transcriptional regulator [Lachnospiraceae bacterium]|nr:helix-turn-helix transcriptional regulator [Lachnospiraceae bacterium]